MSNKLDEQGLVPYPGIGEFKTLDPENIWLKSATAERDALLELVSQWLLEADAGSHYAPHYVEKRITKLKDSEGG